MPARSHVCILGLNFPPEPTGIAPYTGALAVGLARAGHQVVAHVGHPHYPAWRVADGYGQWRRDEHVNGVAVQRRLHYVPRSPRGLRRLCSELSFGLRLVGAKWDRPRTVIAVSPSLFATALAALRVRVTPGRPALIVWVQDIYTLGMAETGEGGGLVHRITRWVERRTLQSADRVVVIHKRFEDFVVEELGIDPNRVLVVRNWTHLPPSTSVPDSGAAREELGWPREGLLAVHTGNMGAKQGLENIVEAARLAQERGLALHFLLVGDGGERPQLEGRAVGISRLRFVNPLADNDYRLALAAADVLIVNEKPGVAAMAVPSKLTSYFDAGRPVIAATDSRGITAAEVKAADAGYVVRAGDPSALLAAILKMASDPDEANRFGLNGRRYREHFLDERAAIEQWLGIITTVAANDKPDAVGNAGAAV